MANDGDDKNNNNNNNNSNNNNNNKIISKNNTNNKMEPSSQRHHAFWSTQPMPHGPQGRLELPEGPIHNPQDIRTTPYNMPPGFEWGDVDLVPEKSTAESTPTAAVATTSSQEPTAAAAATSSSSDSLADLYKLLTNNYVEDDDALFRFDYSPEFLLWALTPPGYRRDWLVGVYSSSNKKLMAFISGIPATLQVYDQTIQVVEINFLCVHKKLRSKRLAPVLIKEITRRANLQGIYQAVYTAGTILPVPVSSARYYHRSLHPKKLVQVGFSRLPANGRLTMARMIKIYALPAKPVSVLNWRPMEMKDVPQVCDLLTKYLQKFQLKVLYNQDDVAHWFLPREGVMSSFVAETEVEDDIDNHDDDDNNNNNNADIDTDPTNVVAPLTSKLQSTTIEDTTAATDTDDTTGTSDGTSKTTNANQRKTTATKTTRKKKTKITDFISFYHLPSSVLSNGAVVRDTTKPHQQQQRQEKEEDYSTLYAAYSYYNIATTISLEDLYKDALILAKAAGSDVFNALNLMDNDPATILEPLKFSIGDGQLQYYLYNWSCPVMDATQVGLVLL